jgi:hypothetical protein
MVDPAINNMCDGKQIIWWVFLLIFLLPSSVNAVCPPGDLNSDCSVDIDDLAQLAERWLAEIDGLELQDFALLAKNWQLQGIPLVINEFMASNSSDSGISDPQGQFDDWLEIYNFADIALDLGGMYITDDLSDPEGYYQIPTGFSTQTTIEPYSFLVLWADQDMQDGPLHLGFRLDAGGEEIALIDTDKTTLIDHIDFGNQYADISYGRWPDAGSDWRFFTVPTPDAQNNNAYLGIVADTQFSHNRGFYDDPFNLSIICDTPGAEIYYTTDGSAPIENETNATGSTKYTAPVPINSNNCIIRAAAIKPGWMPSNIDAHTYIFNADDDIKSMPVVCLVGDEEKTFFEPDGVMAIVGGYYVDGVWQSDGVDSYNNPIQRGIEFERPVSFELIDVQKGTNLQENCGIRVHGSDYTRPRYTRGDDWWTCWVNYWPGWNSNKFSFNLWFRSDYENNRFEHPFFPFIDVDRFKSIVLRAGHNDQCTPFVKDEWARRLFLEMGRVQLTGTFASLYLNGEHKGYFNPTGRGDEEFYQEWYGTDNQFDVITQSGVRNGDSSAWNSLISYANSHDLSKTANYEYVAGKFDIPTFIDFLILEIHIGNFDWPGNNWDVHRERSDDGIFRFSVWDAEGLAEAWYFKENCENCADTAFEDFPSWSSYAGLNHYNDPICYLYRALKANAEFRRLFADHVHRHFRNDGVLTEEHLLTRWWEVLSEVSPVLPETESYPIRFVPDTFIPVREPYVLAAFEENDLFDVDFGYPVFKVNNLYQHGGYISAGDTVTITQSINSGTLYYATDGTDPRTPASMQVVAEGFTVPENAPKTVLVPSVANGGDLLADTWTGKPVYEPFDDSQWNSGTFIEDRAGGVGYEISSGYEPYISIDVEEDMHEINATCYIRIPFTVDGALLPSYSDMELKVRYDDGFIAYINGTEVHRVNLEVTPQWDSQASGGHESYGLDSFDISDHIGSLRPGDNILAIHGLNVYTTSSDFLISAELHVLDSVVEIGPVISRSAIAYAGGFNLNKSTDLKARIRSGTGKWSVLNEAVFALPEVKQNLRITEIMYHPADPNTEFIELKNIGQDTINLNLVSFTNGIDFTFGQDQIDPNEYILDPNEHLLVVENITQFQNKYGTGHKIAGQYTGALNNAGEEITLVDAVGTVIHTFDYKDSWYDITDGDGFSLTIVDPVADPNLWDDKSAWRPSAEIDGSPGYDDSKDTYKPGTIVINEILAHSNGYPNDWIELNNTTAQPVNISGWFLSDDNGDDFGYMKYRIADGTSIPANGYIVFTQDENFGLLSNDEGKIVPFALSENGETLYLRSAAGDVLTGYYEQEDFAASQAGIAFGRYKKSTGTFNFVAMSTNTPGSANAYPKVGPVVITEVMYHPDWPPNSLYGNDEYEYVELYNISSTVTANLWEYDNAQHINVPWKFTDGIDYSFPPGTSIAPGQKIVVVKNPAAFSVRYPTVPTSKIYGPYDGQLNNAGEQLQLSKPGDELDGVRYYIRVDRVSYDDELPWPPEPDGLGWSLHQKTPTLQYNNYSNDVINWQAAAPTPGM